MNRSFSGLHSLTVLLLAATIAIACTAALAADQLATSSGQMKVDTTGATAKKPGRLKRVLTLPPQAPRYKCEDGECVCKGVLDCKSLIDSGFCKGKEFWQDGDDPSAGGCG